jgi:hypothetical protein
VRDRKTQFKEVYKCVVDLEHCSKCVIVARVGDSERHVVQCPDVAKCGDVVRILQYLRPHLPFLTRLQRVGASFNYFLN